MKKEFKELLADKGRKELPGVLLAAAECAPLAKTGGLADVVGTLPKDLKKLGIDARVIIPYHRLIKNKFADKVEHITSFYSRIAGRDEYVGIEQIIVDDVIIYLVDSEYYYGDKIYRGGYPEIEQYAFFARAVLDAAPILGYNIDVIHCNDWHTAMIPFLAKTQYVGGMQADLKFLLTIHNIAFQGKCDFGYIKWLLDIDDKYYTPDYIELYGCANMMKAGCVFSDRINTVSPSYAEEIKSTYYAEGLDGILNYRADVLTGIINGIDKVTFNPHSDSKIPATYDRGHLKGKAICKEELQKAMGLDVNPDVPMFAMVTRMTEQKGFDLVACVLDELMNTENMQFMLLGTGDERFENFMRAAEARYPGKVCAYIGYNDELAHRIYAAADFYLMPSRFEPCGLSQMLAMRYGTLPIVRETGGLRDTVAPYNIYTNEGTGFTFANYDAWEMRDCIRFALECWEDKAVMKGLINRAMEKDFGFEQSAIEYAKHYIWILDSIKE